MINVHVQFLPEVRSRNNRLEVLPLTLNPVLSFISASALSNASGDSFPSSVLFFLVLSLDFDLPLTDYE